MTPFIGDDRNVHPEPLATMRNRGGTWAVFQGQALDSVTAGQLRFLKVGAGCTYEAAPERMPDTKDEIGWKFGHVGYVDLETGLIVDEIPKEKSA
jgi:hypothetical protein